MFEKRTASAEREAIQPLQLKRSGGRAVLPRSLVVCLGIAAIFGLIGIWWGLPELWHPDEVVGPALSMGLHMDPNPHNFVFPSFHKYVIGVVLSPYFIYLKLSGSLSDILANTNQVPSFFIIGK